METSVILVQFLCTSNYPSSPILLPRLLLRPAAAATASAIHVRDPRTVTPSRISLAGETRSGAGRRGGKRGMGDGEERTEVEKESERRSGVCAIGTGESSVIRASPPKNTGGNKNIDSAPELV